jgi:stage V sporulation protein SpoVS
MSPSPTPLTDPGVSVATGDPDTISAAGDWHHRLASTLESHSSLIKSTASVLLTGWSGEASTQYQSLSAVMSGHYEVTAEEARSVAGALKRFSSELGNAQGEGRVALRNAIHWMNEVNDWQDKLAAAEAAKAAAETRVKTAMAGVLAANHAANVPQAAPGAAGAVQQATRNLQAARTALANAETDQSTATKNLKNAADHFTMWQKKGGQALQEAEKAAGVAGLALGAVAISSPPVAGAVNDFVNGMSGSGTASIFAGFSAAAGGGSSLANWQGLLQAGAGASATASGSASITGVQGDASVQAFAGEQGTVTGNLGWSQLGTTGTVSELGGGEADGDVNGQFGLSGVGANATGSVFAGAQADASGTANLGPGSASGHVGVSAGVGAQASGSVDVSAAKIGFSWNVGATLGLGLDVGGSVSVDPSKVISDVNKVMPWNW